MKSEEIEVKLSLPPERAGSFRRSSLLREHKTGRAKTVNLVSTYFDTPDLLLRQNGMALRIRHSGHLREQTLKWSNLPTAGLQARTEYNTPVKSDTPDLDALNVPDLSSVRDLLVKARDVSAIFASHIRRTIWILSFQDSQIEVALDEGEVRSGDQSAPVSEIELELIKGEAIDLVDLAILFARRLDICPEVDSKAGRGYALYRGDRPKAKKVKPLKLAPETSVHDSFRRVMQAGIKQLLSNRPVILAGSDPEGVHLGRVAVRRMRAALASFKPVLNEGAMEKARTELRWMQQELGPARDWDVFLEETIKPLLARMPDNSALRALARQAEAKKASGYESAHALLTSRRFASSILWLERWLLENEEARPGGEAITIFAARQLNSRWKKVKKKAGDDVRALPEATLHELRIELKKLRYLAQLFKSLYPREKTRPYMVSLSAMQECLGGLNDAAVQQDLLDSLKADDLSVNRTALAILSGWHASNIGNGLKDLEAIWGRFLETKPFWR